MARRAPPTLPPDNRDHTIRELDDALYFAQEAVGKLLPDVLLGPLQAAWSVESPQDFADWLSWSLRRFMAAAHPQPGPEMGGAPGEWRAWCPLCGDGAASLRDLDGFSLPVGLERHLLGTHGSRMCCVFRVLQFRAVQSMRRAQAHRAPVVGRRADERPKPWAGPVAEEVEPQTRPSAVVLKLRPDSPDG